MNYEYRCGQGWDSHRTAAGRTLILGRYRDPSSFGLDGHSDADILLHAITDAVLGAAALGDIGMHFPDTDERWKGAGSMQFLLHATELIAAQGFELIYIDSTIVLERPKLKDFRLPIREHIAANYRCPCRRYR